MRELLKTELYSTGSYVFTVGDIMNALLIVGASFIIIRLISFFSIKLLKKNAKYDGRHSSVIKLIRYFIWTLCIIFILQNFGVNITFLIASSAALLVGIGLGLQNVFKDFIAGIILLIDGSIKVDDIVEVDGLVVKVNEITLRTSKVTTRDDNVVIIPNHKFIEDKIVNWTNNMLPTRFMIEVGVDYSSDPRLVEKILNECAISHSDVLNNENYRPLVRFMDFGDSSIDFQLIFFSYNLFRIENVRSELRFKIFEEFRKNNIIIPFPQRVVHYPDNK